MTVRPLSARNPRVAQLERLGRRSRERVTQGAFVVDGPVLTDEALSADLTLEALFVDADVLAVDDTMRTRTERATEAGIPVYALDPVTFARVTDPVTPQGVATVVERRVASRASLDTADLVLVLDQVADPGNLGTLVRVADATGVDVVVTIDGSADPFSPKAVRASAGAILRVPVLTASADDALDFLHRAGLEVVATSVDRGVPHDELDLTGRVAFVLGNEAHGVGAVFDSGADRRAHIVMPGSVESLNVAMAGTVLCFEAVRQRRRSVTE